MNKIHYLVVALYSFSLLSVNQIKDMNYFNQIVSSGNAVIMFTTPTCNPCQVVKPIYGSQSVANVSLYMVNVEATNPTSNQLASQFEVRSYPTFILLRDGQEVKRFIAGPENFKQKFDQFIHEAFGTRSSTPVVTKQKSSSPSRRTKGRSRRRCR